MIQRVATGPRIADMNIECMVEAQWLESQDQLEKMSIAAIEAANHYVDPPCDDNSEVSLLFTSDEQVRKLNSQWRQQDKPTNVLSFAAQDGGGPKTLVLGDIVLACETIASEAAEQGKHRDDHLTHLIVHGFLHLLGFDHQNEVEAVEMEALETDILGDLGIADPYVTQ
jgi:probable rRNA maturation factor